MERIRILEGLRMGKRRSKTKNLRLYVISISCTRPLKESDGCWMRASGLHVEWKKITKETKERFQGRMGVNKEAVEKKPQAAKKITRGDREDARFGAVREKNCCCYTK